MTNTKENLFVKKFAQNLFTMAMVEYKLNADEAEGWVKDVLDTFNVTVASIYEVTDEV